MYSHIGVKVSKFVSTFLILCILLPFTGCAAKKELSDISIADIMGIDIAKDGNVKVSVLAITPTGSNTTMGSSEQSTVWLGTATGASLVEAITNLNGIATKKIVWFHNRYIIISSKYAKNSLNELADYLIRNRETRFLSGLLITEGDVLDMLQVPADIQKSLSDEIEGMAKNSLLWSKGYVRDLKDFMSNFAEKDTDNLIGKIGYNMSFRNTYSTNREIIRKEYWVNRAFGLAFIEGSAVIRRDRFVGFLSGTETRGCLWIMNKVKLGSITVNERAGKGTIAVTILNSGSSIIPEMQDGKININIKLKASVSLTETSSKFQSLNKNEIKKIEDLVKNEIIKEMNSGTHKAQTEYDADVFNFKNYIKIKYPSKWKTMEEDWYTIFPTLEIKYDVKVTLLRFGKILDPLFDYGENSNNSTKNK